MTSNGAIRMMRNLRLGWLLAIALGVALAFPALAFAAQTFAVTSQSGGFPAGGHPTYTTTVGLDTSAGGPTSETITLAPGVLASLAAAPECLRQPAQHTSACQIGSGSATTTVGVPITLTAYLAPPPSSADVAGIDLVTNAPGNPTTHAAVDLVQTQSGNVSSVIKADLSSLGTVGQFVSSISTTVDGTLANGRPFTRMPTNCSPGSSSVTVTYANGSKETTAASPDFAPTGCASLPFAPQLTGTITKDAHDAGVRVVTTETQAPGEAAGSSTTLLLPSPALLSNLAALPLQNTSTPVGSATTTSPLMTAPLVGSVYLTGGPFTPTLTIRFGPPVALSLTGSVNLNAHTTVFSGIPDVPQSSLVVTLFGGPRSLLETTCAPPGGVLKGSFVAQTGATASASQAVTVGGCPTAPKLSGGSLTGLAQGKPALRFKLARGSDAPNLKSFVVSLPHGLRFNSKTRGKGITISAPHSVKLNGGRLSVTLKSAAASVSVKLAGPALVESKQLARQVRSHAVALVTVQITVTDALGKAASLSVSS